MTNSSTAPVHRPPKYDSIQQQAFLELWRTYDCLKAEEELVFAEFRITSQQYNALRLLKAAAPESMQCQPLASE